MIGPTGVGKTEIARRLARLAAAPFLKVEASKFTEVGYVGRDVDSIVRDLVEIAVSHGARRGARAGARRAPARTPRSACSTCCCRRRARPAAAPAPLGAPADAPPAAAGRQRHPREAARACCATASSTTARSRSTSPTTPHLVHRRLLAAPGMEEMVPQPARTCCPAAARRTKRRRLKVPEALEALTEEEADKLIDMDRVTKEAVRRAEQAGIVFIDEIDKIAGREGGRPRPRRLARGRAARPAAHRRGLDGHHQVRPGARPTTCCSSPPAPSTSPSRPT